VRKTEITLDREEPQPEVSYSMKNLLAFCYLQGLPSGMEGEAPTDVSSVPEVVEAEDPDLEVWWARVTPSWSASSL